MTALNSLDCELETARKIFWLLLHDHIFFGGWNPDKNDWDDGAYPAINCNDLFIPGADAESLSAEDLDLYIEVVKRYPDHGSAAWCAVKRNAKLWRQPRSDSDWLRGYEDAVAGVKAFMGPNGGGQRRDD